MNNEAKQPLVFCAKDQVETPHNLTVDGNGEHVVTCLKCFGFIKLPSHFSGQDILNYLTGVHKSANVGQVSLQPSLDASEEAVAGLPTEPAVPTEVPVSLPVEAGSQVQTETLPSEA